MLSVVDKPQQHPWDMDTVNTQVHVSLAYLKHMVFECSTEVAQVTELNDLNMTWPLLHTRQVLVSCTVEYSSCCRPEGGGQEVPHQDICQAGVGLYNVGVG